MKYFKDILILLTFMSVTHSVVVLRESLNSVPAASVVTDANYDPVPQYTFAYNVQDSLTGDSKSQQEVRDGDIVKGSYSVAEPDGTIRTVFYTADPINGFNAIVEKGPIMPVRSVLAAPTNRIIG